VVNGHLRELLLGRNVDSVEGIGRLWDELYFACLPYGRRGIAVMALSGIDLALWDALGKAEGKSVCELFGGQRRQKVRAYASGSDLAWFRDLGFTAHKTSHHPAAGKGGDVEMVQWAEQGRQMLGREALLMVDAYMSWQADYALELVSHLAPYDIYWFEDVLLPDQVEMQAELRKQIKPILLAGGDHEFTAYGFETVARAGALDLWQPDVTWCGGLTATLRIAELAAAHEVPMVLHRGGEIWGLHMIAAGLVEDLGELVLGSRGMERDLVWLGEPEVADGYLELPQGPGFGVEVNKEMI
jgi:L-rhamnonate dehydratase